MKQSQHYKKDKKISKSKSSSTTKITGAGVKVKGEGFCQEPSTMQHCYIQEPPCQHREKAVRDGGGCSMRVIVFNVSSFDDKPSDARSCDQIGNGCRLAAAVMFMR